jgi:signal transduction histidine kinase/CheY-like chemotaxis protein
VNDSPKADPTSLDSVLAGVLHGSLLGVLLLTPQARLCWTNPAGARLLGGQAEALSGAPLRRFFADDDAQRPALERLETCIANNEPLQPGFELRLRESARWLRLELQPLPPDARAAHGLGAAVALSDVTEQRRSREEAGREGQLLREAARLGHIGAWDYDFVAQRLRWSEETFAIHNLPVGEPPTPEDALAYYDEASRPRVREAMRQAQQQGKAFDLPLGLVTATGQHKRVRLIGSAQRGSEGGSEGGRVVRVAGLFHDITEREQHAQALLDKAAAERASRAKSEFLSRVSHELRTPLNGVLGFSQLLLQRAIELPPWTAEPLRLIQRAGDHLLTLIDDMLDLGSIEAGAPRLDLQAVALDAVVLEAMRLVAPQALAAGVVLRSWTPSQAWAHADPMRLRQVLLNLLSNAIKYNRREGEVRVVLQDAPAALVPEAPAALVQGAPAALALDAPAPLGQHEPTALVLRVIDTGPGLSSAQRLELFQPFNRLGAEASGVTGSGLGLTIARHLAEAMGGRLEVAPPAAGGGTELRIVLRRAGAAEVASAASAAATASAQIRQLRQGPAGTAATAAAEAASASAAAASASASASASAAAAAAAAEASAVEQRSCRVLYIEDHPVNAMLVREALAMQQPRHRLRLADSGEQGLEMVAEERPDIVLLDLNLPGVDGYAVLARLRADPVTALLPCIAVSADAMPDEVARARAAGFDDYWTKPLGMLGLAERIAARVGAHRPATSGQPSG